MISADQLAMSVEELQSYLQEKQEALINFRFQKALQQLERPDEVPITRREIARVKTLLRQYELGLRKEKQSTS